MPVPQGDAGDVGPVVVRVCPVPAGTGGKQRRVRHRVPETIGDLRGIGAAAAAGIVAGDADRELEVLSDVTEEQAAQISDYLEKTPMSIMPSCSGYIFDIQIRCRAGQSTSSVQIAGSHTNVIRVKKEGDVLYTRDDTENGQAKTNREAGLLGMQMQMQGTQFYGGDGIVVKGVENTIRNVGVLARVGMAETDKEIIQIMVSEQIC